MSSPPLGVIDASRFPVVSLDGASLKPGDGARIVDDLETLVRHGAPFALIISNSGSAQADTHDDDKARMRWLKENKLRLAAVCKGIISVVPDRERFALVEKQAAGLRAALGIHFVATDSQLAAQALAADLIASAG